MRTKLLANLYKHFNHLLVFICKYLYIQHKFIILKNDCYWLQKSFNKLKQVLKFFFSDSCRSVNSLKTQLQTIYM